MPEQTKQKLPKRRRKPKKDVKDIPRANDNELADLLSKKYAGVNIYFASMVIISLFILATGVAVTKNVAQYRADYKELQQVKREQRALKIKQQQLLLEQQTFSAIPKVSSRAMTELKMYYPKLKNKIILEDIGPELKVTERSGSDSVEVSND